MPIEWALLGRVAFLADLNERGGKREKVYVSKSDCAFSISKISGEDF